MKPEPLFYILRQESDQAAGGPYDIVQMAGLLRRKIITSETPTLLEGEPHTDWVPFCERPQFIVAKEMPEGVVSARMEKREEEAAIAASPVPLPSRETLIKVAAVVVLLLVGAVAVYFLARADTTMGICFLYAGIGTALVAQALIYAMLLDEDWLTLAGILLIPGYDIFYFLSNLDKYLPYFATKYIGLAVAIAAATGLAAHHGQESAPSIWH